VKTSGGAGSCGVAVEKSKEKTMKNLFSKIQLWFREKLGGIKFFARKKAAS
jgi:hypothetical protein